MASTHESLAGTTAAHKCSQEQDYNQKINLDQKNTLFSDFSYQVVNVFSVTYNNRLPAIHVIIIIMKV